MENEQLEISIFLRKHGLFDPRWVHLFKEEHITHPDHLLAMKGSHEKYEVLASFAQGGEQIVLRELFSLESLDNTQDDLSKSELEVRMELHKVGLDSKYWVPIFSKQLGVASMAAINYVGEESLLELGQFTRHARERKALRNLLCNENIWKPQHAKQKEKLVMRHNGIQKLLQELKELQSKGSEYNDKTIKQYEKSVCEMLQISPDSWITNDNNLEVLVAQLQSYYDGIGEMLHARKELSDTLVVQNASGGLALQGIMLSENIIDLLKTRSTLVQIPDNVQLVGSSHPQYYKIETFTNKDQEDIFKLTIENLGYSITTLEKAGFWSCNCEEANTFNLSTTFLVEDSKHEMYCSTVKIFSVPLASYYLCDSELHLSHDALRELLAIEKLMMVHEHGLQTECERFFRRFGSHVSRGPLNFGGIYWWKCSSKGFKQSEMTVVKQLQKEAIDIHANISSSSLCTVSDSVIRAKLRGKYSDTLISQTLLEVSKTGESSKICSLQEWKTGLVASNSTWSLIDRGTTLVPVWKIIELNHKQDFQDVSNFAKFVKRTHESMTKVKHMKYMQDTAHGVIEAVREWNKKRDMSTLRNLLDYLLSAKKNAIKQSLNQQVWPSLYLSQPAIQQFLRTVVVDKNDSSSKVHMQHLIERMDLNSMSFKIFPLKHYISKWLYSTEQQSALPLLYEDFLSLSQYLTLCIEVMNAVKSDSGNKADYSAVCVPTNTSIRVISSVIKSVHAFQCTLRKCGQKYEDLFITTIVYPFKYCAYDITFKMLSPYDLEYICKMLREQSKEFFILREKSLSSMQAYLFIIAIDAYSNKQEIDISESQIKQHLLYLIQEIGDELQPLIIDSLTNNCLTEGFDWKNLQLALESTAKDLPLPLQKQSGQSVQKILQQLDKKSTPLVVKMLLQGESDVPNGNNQIQNLFTVLGLIEYYPQKLSLRDALLIRRVETTHCLDRSQSFLFILHKLMSYDFSCRKKLLIKPSEQEEGDTNESSSEEESDSDDDSSSDDDCKALSDQATKVHPMDGLLALLHCADDFLRQDLMARLVTCQLAIPFILPDPFTQQLILPLWAMKSIVKEWKCTLSGKAIEQEGPIVNYPTPIISFIRFGKHARSKSNMINDVMNDSHHDHFFHRDCEGGNIKQLLGEGLVETSWYFPSGKPSDIFPDAVMFLNLHGDACHHPRQAAFLGQISFMTVVLLTEGDINEKSVEILQQHSETPGGFILLFCASELEKTVKQENFDKLKKVMSSKLCTMKLKKKNRDDIKNEIRRQLNKKLQQKWTLATKRMTLGECTAIAHRYNIYIDEDCEEYTEGQELAHTLQRYINDFLHQNPQAVIKEVLLPLQGVRLWQKWAHNNEEQCRQVNKGSQITEEYCMTKKKENELIREEQFKIVRHNFSPLMESFITALINTTGNVRKYFLQCLNHFMNDFSREKIIQLRYKYQEKKDYLLELQTSEEPNQHAIKKCKEEIQDIHDDMINASFGREHLLRELGQVYEAVVQSHHQNDVEQYTHLPKVAAELMVEGYPLELMDGDAAHVPITWVKAVLHEVVKILHDPQVFIMSVLGLQSTGKSTLLNSAFGLQFNVSAGRCTRGAFMQLLPISKQLKEEVNCDYVLIVDTEGLRAPELDSLKMQKHDNELATFVIGLANVTMINIKGETPGDMDDILQIAVHAFLRMKSVKLNPRCQFIHQNVGAVLASTKGGMGRTRFKHKLDDMTLEAAKEEKCEGQYENFSDVIQFDEQLDVHFFPSLWKGDPPMAPVNDGYSEKAQALKAHLAEVIRSTSSEQLTTVAVKISDLWKAFLNEGFVFRFKNTMEIAVYNSLNTQYYKWAQIFRSKMITWELDAEKRIKDKERVIDKLKVAEKILEGEIPSHVDKVHEDIKKEIEKFFEESKQRKILEQWRSETQFKLNSLAHEVKDHAVSFSKQIVIGKMAFAKLEDAKISYCKQALEEIASGNCLTDNQLMEIFDQKWLEWMQAYKYNPVLDENFDVVASVQNTLSEYFINNGQVLRVKLQRMPLVQWGKPLKLAVNKDHVRRSKVWTRNSAVGEHHMKQAQALTDNSLREARNYLQSKRNSKFSPVYTYELLTILFETVIKDSRSEGLIFEQSYWIDLSLTACGYAVDCFMTMNMVFKEKYDPIQYLGREMKKPLFTYFKHMYHTRK